METEQIVELVEQAVDQVINHPDPAALVDRLNERIANVQARYTVLSAVRDSLLPDDPELQIEEAEPIPLANFAGSRGEQAIVDYVREHGPSKPSDIAKAIGMHHTYVGRTVRSSSVLAKEGPLVVLAKAS